MSKPNDREKPPRAADANRRLLRGIMLAVLIWGSLLALGALLIGPDETTGEIAFAPNVWRGLIVLACVGIFLGGWALLLRSRRSA